MLKKIAAVIVVLASCVSLAGIARAELIFYVPVGGGVADDIVGGNAGTALGDPVFGPDTPAALGAGQSVDFGNDAQVIDFGNIPLLEGATTSTVSMWVNPFTDLDAGERHYTLSKDGQLEFGFRDLEITNRVNNADNARSTGLVLETGVWSHIASVFDAAGFDGRGSTTHYFNGVQLGDPIDLDGNPDAGANEGGLEYVITDSPLILGNRFAGDNKEFDGKLDDIAVWDTALSAEIIAALAAGEVSPPEAEDIPEPSTLALVTLGLIGLLGAARRRRRTT